jgi:hypothetical protein
MPALIGNLQQLQDHGLVLAQHFAGGDAEQQRIADLACGASDGDSYGFLAHEKAPGGWKAQRRGGGSGVCNRMAWKFKGADPAPG